MKDVRIEHEQMAVLPEFASAVHRVGQMLRSFPDIEPRFLADCLYPFPQVVTRTRNPKPEPLTRTRNPTNPSP